MKHILLALIIFALPSFAIAEEALEKMSPPPQLEPAPAPDKAQPAHGVAMHGTLKYAPDFIHLDYANPDAPKGGTLKQHVIGSFDSLNPFIVKGSPAAGVSFIRSSLLHSSLMQNTLDEPFSLYGIVAESVEIPEDRSSVTFNLRPEAKWHDGKPITAHDVKWTFETMLEQGQPFFKAYWGDVSEVIAENDRRVTYKFKQAGNMELPLIVAEMTILPKHYWTEKDADGNLVREFNETSLDAPLGSGPYKVSEVKAGSSITYERADNWWGRGLPYFNGMYNFDRVKFDYYRDNNVALEAFFAGEYDVREEHTAKLWHTSYENASAVKSGNIIKEDIENERPAGMQAFVYNIRRDVFKDAKVREALGYAFDFEWSNKQFAYGGYTRTRSFYENSDLAATGLPSDAEIAILEPYRDQIPAEVFTAAYKPPVTDGSGNLRKNLRTAMILLDEAGYKLGADKVRSKNGVRLEFEILGSNPAFERWILPFTKNLERIGVKANFRVVDSAQFQNRISSYDYDMTIGTFGQSSSPGNEQRDFWGSEKADMAGSRNLIGVKNPAVDSLIEKIIHAKSRDSLVNHVQALDRILQWNHYVIPMWHYPKWRIARWSKIERPTALSGISPAIATTWWHAKEASE